MTYLKLMPDSDQLAISNFNQSITYNELKKRVSDVVRKYQFFQERSVVWIDCRNTIETLIYFLAFWEKNCCTIPIDPQMTLGEIQSLYKIIPPNLIINQSETSKIKDLPLSKDLNSDIQDANTVQLSSGSTGEPKIILISNKAILFRALSNRNHLRLNVQDKTLCTVPLSHSHGIDCLALPTLFAGGQLYINDPQSAFPYRILDWIEKYKITFFSSIPQMYDYFNQVFLQNNGQKKWNLDSLRYPFCGSAALPLSTANDFNKNFNLSLRQGYGLAEIGVICVNLKTEFQKYDSIGEPIAGIEWKLASDGELLVKSDALFSGYYKKSQETADRMNKEGYLQTEDLINIDNGFFYIVGRKNDFINVMGKKVYPKEIEEKISKCINIKEFCVTGAPDTERGQIAVLHLLDTGENKEGVESLIYQDLQLHLESYKIPRKIVWHKSFPKSPLGKILKSKL